MLYPYLLDKSWTKLKLIINEVIYKNQINQMKQLCSVVIKIFSVFSGIEFYRIVKIKSFYVKYFI